MRRGFPAGAGRRPSRSLGAESEPRVTGHEAVTVRKMPGGSRDCSVLESILETVLKEV